MKHGFLPVPVHYAQPIPDLEDLARRRVWDRISPLSGIRIDADQCLDYLKDLARQYAGECCWPCEDTGDPAQFYLHNGCFSYGCAAPLHCIIRRHRPEKIVEVGSGNSTRVISGALALNEAEGYTSEHFAIDPYASFDPSLLPHPVTVMKEPVESVDMEIFSSLGSDDILFIDSSHVCRIGGDVNYEILDILPHLSEGVLIHFHDIPMPYEYPKVYACNPAGRYFWTESYLLQAFLAFNDRFEVILPMALLCAGHKDELEAAFPCSSQTDFGWVSGSFWITRSAGG